eukprot:3939621-Rhodomonas_salina.1
MGDRIFGDGVASRLTSWPFPSTPRTLGAALLPLCALERLRRFCSLTLSAAPPHPASAHTHPTHTNKHTQMQ